ncbi:WD40 repeat domain-containing protein [Phytohabitans flavus]|uniref:WD40 repeat domain-containing protein n=1 Tax=Phytohabitans flavus TaxID=1076124 RepID=UPI00362B00E9
MVDPVQFLGRKLANAAVDAVASKIKKAYRERKKAPDLRQARFERVMTLTGHQAGPGRYQGMAVYSIDVLQTADVLVTGGADGTVRIWPLDGSPSRVFLALSGRRSVRSVAFSGDGRLAVGGDDRRIVVTEAVQASAREARIATAFPYRQAIERVVWSADDTRLAALTREGHLVLCTPADGSLNVLVRSWLGEYVSAPCIRFTPDGRAVVRNTYDAVEAVTLAGESEEGTRTEAPPRWVRLLVRRRRRGGGRRGRHRPRPRLAWW